MINAGTVAAYLTLDTSAFDAGINSAVSGISIFNIGGNALRSTLQSMENAISSAGRYFADNLAQPVAETTKIVTSKLSAISVSLGLLPFAAFSSAQSFVSSWRLIPSAVSSSRTTITSACSGIVSSASSALNKLPSTARGIMVQTGNGMVAGLSATQGSIFAKARYIASTVASKMRSALNIHSPSRVTREIGRFTVEGMALGMDDNADKLRQQAAETANIAAEALSFKPRQNSFTTANAGSLTTANSVDMNLSGRASVKYSPGELVSIAEKLERCVKLLSENSTSLEIDGRSFGRLVREYSQGGI